MISGVLNVYKEKGYTSHDVVARLRGILGQKKIGHTGTLDPDAEGVLVVCLGSGTKLCDMLTDSRKIYQATLLLGVTTDTQDATGTVLEQREVNVSREGLEACMASFEGGYDQIPPMYSAKKVNGKKLYELARSGMKIDREPQFVHIDEIQIENISFPEVVFTVRCSKGTYIRTLCSDIGEKLGCGGCMKALKRTRSGNFTAKQALRLEEIERLRDEGTLAGHIYPVDSMFPDLRQARVRPDSERYLKNGNPLSREQLTGQADAKGGGKLRVYDTKGRFCGIYRWEDTKKIFWPEKMFLGDD